VKLYSVLPGIENNEVRIGGVHLYFSNYLILSMCNWVGKLKYITGIS